jgi:hypothetical protein
VTTGLFGWGEAGWGEAGPSGPGAQPADAGAQWTQGTIDLTRGSASVVGVGTDWEGNVLAGHLLMAVLPDVIEASVVYEVDSVSSDEALVITAPWQGPSTRGAPYVVHRRTGSLPRLRREDENVAPLMTYTLAKIDRAIEAFTPPEPGEDWILSAGAWSDAGIWRDTEDWQD